MRANFIHLLAVMLLCGAGCSEMPGPAVLSSHDSASKIRAMKAAARQGRQDPKTLQLLIDDLDSADAAVRLSAIKSLETLTQQTMAYDWTADREQRRPALRRWQAWLDERLPSTRPASRPAARSAEGA